MITEPFNRANAQPFNLQIRNTADAVEITIYGVVGDTFDGVTPGEVAAILKANRRKPVNVRINSPGGLAYDGITILNSLISHDARVTTTIEGIAASAAAIIAMAGDTIRVFENATLMIHRAWLMTIGNIDHHIEIVDNLRRIDDQIASTIATRRGLAKSKVVKLMEGKDGADGTSFNATEAKAAGLVDEVIELGSAKKPKPGNLGSREQQARARRLRMMEMDRHATEFAIA